MGSLDVMDKDGGQFIIASGFSDEMRVSRRPKAFISHTNTTAIRKPASRKIRCFYPSWTNADVGAKTHFGRYISALLNLAFLFVMLMLALTDAISHRRGGTKMNFKSAIVSVGLLGTFVGIWWGLYNFESSNITRSVPALLDGLKLSFVTSITGIGLSVLLSIVQTIGERQNTRHLSDLSTDINRLADILEKLKGKNPAGQTAASIAWIQTSNG